MFDEKTQQQLRSYVYMLLDPIDKKPFYIGKGNNNRVFQHMNCALTDIDALTAKYEKIRGIINSGNEVEHVIVRHGMTDQEAFQVESSLIDSFNFCGVLLTNEVLGHNSLDRGLMTANEVIRLYNAEPLNEIGADCVIININKKYGRAGSTQSIYEATKETWRIGKGRLNNLKYVLSEFRGLIVEVFEVQSWYGNERIYLPGSKKFGETYIGVGFNGVIAPDQVRNLYINKSIAHTKKKGAMSPIRFNI